ncbi:uncharacterized protein LOC128766050 [Synchiropus splendidus]|uniref:uncharacterized protein LOC128766050 n=1 Tax=Synchiropus splendidus TaxID=270530 RepID=UPI00237E19BB|nr:uncharacterized protein LOC128766050 [Synchiropus splendidus]
MGAPLVSCLFFTFTLAAAQETGYSREGDEIHIKPPDFGPPEKIVWRRNGKEVVTFDGREQQEYRPYRDRVQLDWLSAELRIRDGQVQDSGVYELELWFKNRENLVQNMFYRWEVIDEVSITRVSCEMVGDHQAKLLCSADCSHPELLTFEWRSNGTQHPGPNMTLLLEEPDDRVFTCRVRNPVSQDEATLAVSRCFPETPVHQSVVPIVVVLLVIALLLILGFVFRKKLKALCAATSPADVEKQAAKQREAPLRRALNFFRLPPGKSDGSPGEENQAREDHHLLKPRPDSVHAESDQGEEESRSVSRVLTLPSHQPLAPLLPSESPTPGSRTERALEREPRSAESDGESVEGGGQESRPVEAEAGSHDLTEEAPTGSGLNQGDESERSDNSVLLPDGPQTKASTESPTAGDCGLDSEGTREETESRSAESDGESVDGGGQESRPAEAGSHDLTEEAPTELDTNAGHSEDTKTCDPNRAHLPGDPEPETESSSGGGS